MVLNKHELKFKKALAEERELNSLYRELRAIQPIKLDVPIQKGYIRTLELNDDVKRRRDFDKINAVFKKLGVNPVYHENIDFKTRKRNKRKGDLEKPKFIVTELHAGIKSLRDPRISYYPTENRRQEMIDWIEEYKKYLTHHSSIYQCQCAEYTRDKTILDRFTSHYVFAYPWMLKEVTKPYMLTHYYPVNGDLESRIKKLNTHLYYYGLSYELYGRSVLRWDDEKPYLKKKYAFHFNEDELDEVNGLFHQRYHV